MKKGILILTGGRSTRMGQDKASLTIQNDSFLERVCKQVKDVDCIWISDNKERKHIRKEYGEIVDEYDNIGPINGIVSCFHQSDVDAIFVIACDMPFITKDSIDCLYTYLDCYDGVFVQDKEYLYTLGGIYTRKMLPIMEQQIDNGCYSLRQCIRLCDVCILNLETLSIDENAFLNINTIEEYNKLF